MRVFTSPPPSDRMPDCGGSPSRLIGDVRVGRLAHTAKQNTAGIAVRWCWGPAANDDPRNSRWSASRLWLFVCWDTDRCCIAEVTAIQEFCQGFDASGLRVG